jgi:hypothetical protein
MSAARKYPRGRIGADDEGQLAMAVTVRASTVIVAFPKPVSWIGLGADDARALAALLLKRADEISH